MPPRCAFVLALAIMLALVAGSAEEVSISNRKPTTPLMQHVARQLAEAGNGNGSQDFSNSTSLDKVFNGVTLFKYSEETDIGSQSQDGGLEQTATKSSGIEIKCATCYSKGNATASLSVQNNFNASLIMDTVDDAVADTMGQLTDWMKQIEVDGLELDIPPFDIDIDIEVPDFPEAVIEFQFDGVELYVELDTTFSRGFTYQLSLFRSTEMGIQLTQEMFLGLVFAIDLILSTETEITIQSGFHVKLDDGILLKMALFAEESSDMVFNGGHFEFLPVTVESEGVVLKAILQLSLRAGFSFTAFDLTPGYEIEVGDLNSEDFTVTAGVESRIFANVAEFVTNITANTDDDADCALNAVQEYRFVVGAAAGASVGLGERIWGPTPSTEVPVFTTTIAEVCAQTRSFAANTTTEALHRRAPQDEPDLETTTLTREETYIATRCESTGLVNCPASLQTVVENIAIETMVTAVRSGVEASWPVTTDVAALTAVAFGDNVKDMVTTTGKPETYDGGDGDDDDDDYLDRKTGGVSNAVIIGLSVGLGVPFLIAVIFGTVFLYRRRRNASKFSPSAPSTSIMQVSQSSEPMEVRGDLGGPKKVSQNVLVTEK